MAEDLSILNDPPAVLEGPQLLHELISWEENADACALDFTKNDRRQHYTYREFQSCYKSLVDRILESLVKQHAQNDGPLEQHIVPLLIPQSPGLYISQLAILNSGGAFCPLNLDSPVERLKFNVSDVKAKFVITTSDFQDAFSWEDGPEVILVDEFPQTKKDASTITRPLPREVSPEDLAYVMYTSGSSGTPKGVAVSHLAASQSLLAHELFLPKFERFLQFAAPSFDVSVFEIFFPLKRGKTLVGCDKTQLMNDLPGIITQLEIDAAELTPGVAGSLLEKRSHAPGLKLLLTIGEMLTTPVVEEFGGSETQENILYGMYGPTEAAIHCTVYPEMEANAKPGNIGVPFATVSTFIAVPSTSIEDAANLQFLPIGELGELVVGGPQVARGYLNREEQNKAAFVHFEGRNYYRTGDKARQLPNGTIEILGRISSGQVKLRGQRLELGEVEEAVYKHSGVKTAIAAVIDKSLVVYTLVRDGNVQSNELIDTCAKWLPKYMIPSEIIILENFPYLPSGKIDKRKLNSDYQDTKKIKETEETISLTDTQVIVKKVLDDVLGSFRPTLRLAAAGLDSLLAIRVSSKLRLMGFNINTIAVLQAENLEALAKLCEDSKSATPSEVSKVLVSSTETVLLALNGNVKDMETTMKCTPLQSAMLAETSKDPRAYRNWVELELVNITDVDQVTKSLELLSTSNPILRTGFMEARDLDGWVQIVWNKSSVIDVEEVETLKYTFDPAKDTSFHRPIRFQLLRLPSSTKILVHIHHALYDAWSLELLLDDLDMLLGGKPLLQRPSFRAIVDNCFDGTHESDNWLFKDYWKDHLQDLEIRALPNFHPGNIPSPELAIVHRRTSILTSEVEVAARALSVSPHTIFQAAYCLVLGSYLGATDLCFGSVFSGRTLPINGIEDIAGPCLATLPIRVDTAVAKSLGELVQELNLTNRKHLEHSALPLKNIKSAAGVYPGQQLFDSLIIWQQTLHSHGHHREFVNLVDAVDNLEFNLTLEVTPGMEYIDLKANYQCALFPEKQISTFLQQLEALARLVVENPSTDIKCCFNQFHSTLMSTENENPQISLKSSTLSSPVERIAAEDPNRPAIDFLRCVDEDKVDVDRMSYLELNIRSNQIGGYLLEQKVLPDELVCICMEKCVDLYAAILAVTKVGAGYLPQTPEVPSDRLRHILQESGVKLVLAQSSSRPLLKTFSWLRVVYLDEVDFGIFSKDNITPRSSPEHLSYCVYTSGSTGTPKGVLVTQGNLISNLDVLEDLYPIPKETRLLQQCSQAFDVSVFEIFFTWRVGGCLCSAIKDVLFRDMESAIRSLNVTHLSMTPSVAALLDPESIPNVGFLVTAGEAVTPKVKNAWAERGLWQGYGPSETTNICTVKPNVTHKDAINIIGPPLRNTSAFVLSPETEFSLVPLGGEGEFVFGGAQVFRGYMDKTKEIGKIIDHPVHGRLYRSGDFGRMLSDGSLAFTCRKDDQVKIRGQRVELGEINNTMLQSHFVRDCVTMIIDDDCGQRLVCFWAAAGDAAQDLKPLHPEQPIISELYKRLESTLPPYMVPSALIPMSRLPSTVQGKIDKRYLMSTFHKLEVDYLDLASQARKPLTDHVFTPLETEIANAVAMVTKLRVEDIQAETSFFSLGLDSISAISLSRILRQTYKQKVEISDVLKSPSVSRLAERISSRDIGLGSVTEIVGRPLDFEFDDGFREMITERFMESNKRVEAIYPCTPLQEAMLSAGESSSLQLYDNQVIFNVNGDVNKLKGCWREMVQRHEILRTCFLATDMPRFPFVQVVLEQHEILFTPTSEKVDDAGKTEPPYAINLTENNGISKLIVSMHHALYDGVALSVLYEEIETLYNDQLLPPPVSFAPFLKSMLSIDTDQCDKFWEVIMRNCKTSKFTSLHEISEDDQPQCHKSQAIAQYSLSWVEESVRSNETSLLAVCHTAWACILAELHQDSDVCFGNVVSGRVASVDGIERLVAPCFNTIPVRLSQLDRLSYIEAFRKFQCLNADSLPFQLAPLRRIQSKFSPDGSRLFDSLLILQQPVASRNSSIWSIENDSGAMDIPLVCEIVPNPVDDTLEIILHSYTSYFSRDTISDIMRMVQDKIQYALQNPRRQILSTILKEKIVTKTDSQRNANSAATIDNPIEALSMEEETLREAISTFTDVPAKNITRDISFFRLGLDSISIVQVASRLRKLGHKVKASDILERPSIGQLNAFLSISQKDPGTSTNNFDFERFDNQYRQVICSKANIDSEDIEAVRPCTYVQQGMLATTLHSGGHDYMNATWFDILPEILIESLRDAWQTVSENHEMLRTGFVSVDDPEFSFAMITFKKGKRQLPWYDAGNQRSISQDLLQEPWGLTLYTIDDKNVLCLRAHHAIYDAQSMQMVLSDVAKVYASKSTPPSRPLINTFLSEILKSSQDEQAEKEIFWKSSESRIAINRFPDLNPLHVEDTTSSVQEVVCQASKDEIEADCRANGVTMQAATQAAWARLLAAYIGENSTTFGLTLSGRSVHEDGDRVCFPSIVTLPARCDIFGTNAELLSRTMAYNAALHKHQFTPLTTIQKWAGYPAGKIFDTLFAYQKLPDIEEEVEMPWVISKEEASVDYAISMEVQPLKCGRVILRLTFRQDVIPQEQAKLLLQQYDTLLLDILKNPEASCEIAPQICKELLSVTPALEDVLPGPVQLLHDFVTFRALNSPEKFALEFATSLELGNFKSQKWTYRQLDEISNQVANFILQYGLVSGDIVAICFDKCPEASMAIIGILKAGCAYVALDPTAPDERSKFIVEDSAAKLILTRSKLMENLASYMTVDIFALDSQNILDGSSMEAPILKRNILPDDTSYCLYTSGTTGTPKGCLITHDNAVQFMLAFSRIFEGHWDDDSKYLQFASFHFDVSVMEQFWSWSVGICVASAPRDLIFEDITGAIQQLGITHIDLTPSLARLVHPDDVPSLRKGAFITGGEQLKQEILDDWGKYACIYNGYGPTEATIGCTMYPRVPINGKPSNIGPAYVNVGSFVLTPGTELPVLRGGIGELCVSGKLVGNGYLNRPDLTAERFPTLKEFNKRIYRTGDLVRILHDGSFIFLGRADDQVKLRGQRLELSEINQVIRNSMQDIQDVVTLVLKHTAQQKEQLVTFFVLPLKSAAVEVGNVIPTMREACKSRLPGYMVPTHFIPIEAIPLSPNNKADSKQLKLTYDSLSVEYLQTLSQSGQGDKQWTEHEQGIVNIIATALRAEVASVTRSSSVFELGLDSISIISFSRALQDAGLENAKLSIVRNNSSIGALVRALLDVDTFDQSRQNAKVAISQEIAAFSQKHIIMLCKELGISSAAVEGIYPCTPVQEGMIYRFLESDQPLYFNKFEFLLHDSIDTEKLFNAWGSVVAHLDILRTSFVATDDGFAQVVKTHVSNSLSNTLIDYHKSQKSIALQHPYSVRIESVGNSKSFILHIFHGLYDGNSLTMMLRRVIEEYKGLDMIDYGPPFMLSLSHGPLLKSSGAEKFWQTHLQGWSYHPMPQNLSVSGDIVSTNVLTNLAGFETLRKQLGVTPQAIIQAVWISVLQTIISPNLTIGIVTSGRTIDFENADKVIGPLFNTVPFHIEVESSFASAALVEKCHQFNMQLLEFQHTPLKDIQRFGPSRPGQQLFDTLFVFQRPEAEDEDLSNGFWTQIDNGQEADVSILNHA
jgi:amino acid adenylation domain-containing protein